MGRTLPFGNIDLTTDAGISAARSLVNQRNQESRISSRRVMDGLRHAAMKGTNHGGPNRPGRNRRDGRPLFTELSSPPEPSPAA